MSTNPTETYLHKVSVKSVIKLKSCNSQRNFSNLFFLSQEKTDISFKLPSLRLSFIAKYSTQKPTLSPQINYFQIFNLQFLTGA